jgi:DNA-binding beta-propeller fold protein YncE
VGGNPRGVAVNLGTNKVYVVNVAYQTVSMVDGDD